MSFTRFSLVQTLVPLAFFVGFVHATSESLNPKPNSTPDIRYPAPLTSAAKPDPSLSPAKVVRIQMRALQNNGANDAGIRTTYRFASPANKQVTGPYERFAQMIKATPYRPMLNSETLSFGEIRVKDAQATQEVQVIASDGQEFVYVFLVRRQDQPPYKGCWMTDGVLTLPKVKDENYMYGPPGFG